MKHKLINHSGYTLLGVILVITIISVLGLSVVGVTLNAAKTSSGERDDQSVFYIAEAGLTVEMANMKQKAMAVYEQNGLPSAESCHDNLECMDNLRKTAAADYFNQVQPENERLTRITDFEKVVGSNKQPHANITITHIATDGAAYSRTYKISSLGSIDEKHRTVEQVFTLQWPGADKVLPGAPDNPGGTIDDLPEGTAVYVKGDIQHDGGTIVGHLGTLKCAFGAINITNWSAKVTGNMYVPEACENKNIKVYNEEMIKQGIVPKEANGAHVSSIPALPAFPVIPKYDIPDDEIIRPEDWDGGFKVIEDGNLALSDYRVANYTLKMDKNLKFNEIEIVSNRTLNIDIGNANREIVVENLNLRQGKLNIIGDGKLNIYVLDDFYIGGIDINRNGKNDQVNILYNGSNDLYMGASNQINASFYAKQSNITISGSADITGNIFTGGSSLIIEGGSSSHSQMILAPNAHVEITGSGNINGTLFANSFFMTGGTNIEYIPGWVEDGPITLPPPDESEEGRKEEIKIDEYIDKEALTEV